MTREEAINTVRNIYQTDKEKEALEILIPELAESEDEKIRKWIIAEIKATHDYDSSTSAKCVDDALAWLEKQKERKPSDLPTGFYFIDKDGNKYYSKEFRFNNGTFTTTMKVGEEHKPSWSKEDEEMINVLVNYVKDPSCWYLRCPREKLVAFIESLPERFNLEPKQEWSDEDEKYLNRVINLWVNDFGEDSDTVKWLKSLRPRPHWEPSEQEKGALRTAIHVLTDERNFPKAAAHLQNILNAFEGEESRKDWKPSDEQMKALSWLVEYVAPSEEYIILIKKLYEQLKKL